MNPHIPDEISQKENAHIVSRRRKFGIADDAPALGIALSGGGIRSATVSLGVFQYLAREEKRGREHNAEAEAAEAARTKEAPPASKAPAAAEAPAVPPHARPLSRIDYLSSVSGGGYFATFFGSLFLPRDERAQGAQITPEILPAEAAAVAVRPPPTKWERAAERAADTLDNTSFDGSRMTPMRWLRENGRYLAPTGGGDYLYALLVAVRNFFGIHYVIGVSLAAIFLLVALLRVLGSAYFPDFWVGTVESHFMPRPGANFWLSVWWVPAVAVFALMVVPVGVAFFLAQTERKGKRIRLNLPLITAIIVALLCFVYAFAGDPSQLSWPPAWRSVLLESNPEDAPGWGWQFASAYIGFVASLAAIIYLTTKRAARRMASEGAQPEQPAAAQPAGTQLAGAQTPRRDFEPNATTIAQTMLSHAAIGPLLAALTLGAYALVDTIGQTVYALWTVDAYHKWVVGGGTIALLIPLLKKLLPLVTGSGDPGTKAWVRIPMSGLAFVAGVVLFVAVASLWSALTQGVLWHGERPYGDPGCVMIMPTTEPRDVALDSAARIVVTAQETRQACEAGEPPLGPGSWAWLFVPLLLISIFTGRRVGFINLSSLQRYYAGYLMRSYLRASLFAEDPEKVGREEADGHAGRVERDVRRAAREDDITVKAYYHPSSLAPLHFINVTMNQTVASGSQLVQRDRKGMNVAIGPMGFSIGNRSFVAWDPATMDYELQRCPAHVIGEADVAALPRCLPGTQLVVEPLSIGNWCAISGAAFTTGHGKGTTLGLSLLLALTNVRLGYWWNAEIEPPHPTREELADSPWFEKLSGGFRTQRFLLNEMLARYYGTRRSHWYLSDGGHFENTAAYELIRRRVPRIVVLDNGRDAEYAFDDVANLVRKARIDLDAEIVFLTAGELTSFVDTSVRKYFGTPEEFKAGQRGPLYATLARVLYADAPESLMLVLKPRVAGIEPLDILNYKQASSDFPQQSTTDQFYDEAQWESYRTLGYWIADRLFAERAVASPDMWVPRKMFE
jgi:hypothetical protein